VRTYTEQYQLDLIAFNEHQHAVAYKADYSYPTDSFDGPGNFLGYTQTEPVPRSHFSEPETQVTIDKTATPVYSCAAINFMNLQAYTQLRVHPKGHYSSCILTGVQKNLDVLSARSKASKDAEGNDTFRDMRTTHRAMFNGAFGQSRVDTYYDGTGSFGFEAGSYRLTGHWLPYKEKQ
jgi:hypothetical protein